MISAFPSVFEKYHIMVEKSLSRLFPEEENIQKNIFEASRYSLLNGGKRLRPLLFLTFFELCGGNAIDAVDFASAIEMIHSYSLVHDDLPCMDNSDTRRGKPSNHIKFGEATAVLAGDALLNRAFEVMSMDFEGLEPKNQLSALHCMATYSGVYGMIGGQVIDLMIEGEECSGTTHWEMVTLKTSALFAGACKSGALLAGASNEKADNAAKFGHYLGLAFQMTDDLLDVIGDAETFGKPVGHDAENDKNTFISIYGIERTKELIEEYTRKAIQCGDTFGVGSGILSQIATALTERNY